MSKPNAGVQRTHTHTHTYTHTQGKNVKPRLELEPVPPLRFLNIIQSLLCRAKKALKSEPSSTLVPARFHMTTLPLILSSAYIGDNVCGLVMLSPLVSQPSHDVSHATQPVSKADL
eukprot:1844258-Amphidinium_carterae.3